MTTSSKKGNGLVEIDPSIVYFTHSRIRPFFTGCGVRVTETLSDLLSGKLSVADLPPITIVENDGFYFSLNNRRLFVLKSLRESGFITTIKVRIKPALPRERERYTIGRCALRATIMKERDNCGGEEREEENETNREEEIGGKDAADVPNESTCNTRLPTHTPSPSLPLPPVVVKGLKNLHKMVDKRKYSQAIMQLNDWLQSNVISSQQHEMIKQDLNIPENV